MRSALYNRRNQKNTRHIPQEEESSSEDFQDFADAAVLEKNPIFKDASSFHRIIANQDTKNWDIVKQLIDGQDVDKETAFNLIPIIKPILSVSFANFLA